MYLLSTSTLIKAPIGEVWDFFSLPENLGKITPPSMQMKIKHKTDNDRTFTGQLILYSIQPFPFTRFEWLTEIKNCIDQKMFIDEQRKGPYKFWYHIHLFEEFNNTTIMKDFVYFELPLYPLARITGIEKVILQKLREIFAYRKEQIHQMFSVDMNSMYTQGIRIQKL